jgi:hypothetical protein
VREERERARGKKIVRMKKKRIWHVLVHNLQHVYGNKLYHKRMNECSIAVLTLAMRALNLVSKKVFLTFI